MIDRVLLKILVSDRAAFERFYRIFSQLRWPEPIKIVGDCIIAYYQKYTDTDKISRDELRTYFDRKYPVHHLREHVFRIIDEVYSAEINESLQRDAIKGVIQRSCAAELSEAAMQVLQGHLDHFDKFEAILSTYRTLIEETEEEADPFYSESLAEMYPEESAESGLSWPLKAFEEALGPLCGSTSGHIFARPETGKTSMAIYLMVHWVQQIDGYVLWCNNEESRKKMRTRLMCSMLNMTQDELLADRERNQALFEDRGGERVLLYDQAHMMLSDIEALIKEYQPRIVVIDIADKVHFVGEEKFDNVMRLQRLYALYRELCKTYEIDLLTLGQASADADGKRYLEFAWMDHSKTGKAAELDWICGIGKDPNAAREDVRYLHFCKNKLTGRHSKHVVTIDPRRCVFYDV